MDKKRNVPEIRFAGFTDDWEQRKLGDLVERVTRKNTNLESNLPLTISAQYGLISQTEFFDKQVASRDISGYYLIENGEFAYNKSYSNGYPWGAIKRLDRHKNGVLSTLYICFKPTKINSQFLVSYYDSQHWYSQMEIIAVEGARNHGLLNIPTEDFFNTVLSIPRSEKEQATIGNFFKQLDETIALHQREYEKYKNLKVSYLEKMFPKENEQFPELRFPEFTDAWEQRKLGDCIEDYIERTTIQNQYPVLTSSQKQGIVFQEDYFADRQVTTENNVGYFVLPKGYFTYRSRSDNGVFRFNRNDLIDKGIISYFYPVFRIKDNDSNFFLQLLNSTIDEQVSFEAEGTGQKVLSLKKFKNVVVTIPSLHEQATIGNFFKQLDETIALHQRGLEKYKQIKQSYLEKMFI